MLEMALDHPRLVNLKEVYETSTELILITEYCAGGELFTECILEEKFNEANVRLLMSQILEGLVYLHDRNIVHLDLKPQNILLTEEFPQGSIKICDLGFACLVNTGEDIRDIIGTPDYVAPEVLNYDPLGLYTDMWSLGVLTYVMLTTCSPFAGDDKQQTFCNITTVNLDFPEDLFEEISDAAQDFIRKLLIAEPSERMTAVECMHHEWITGAVSPSKQISPVNDLEETPINSDTKVTEEEDESTGKSELHEKVRDEASEMSVTYGECESEGMRSRTSSEGVDVLEHPDTTKHPTPTSTDAKLTTHTHSIVSNNTTIPESDTEKRTNTTSEHGDISYLKPEVRVNTSEFSGDLLQTPDSESSMCISDNRLDDDDSGVGTGTETRGESETRTVSRRSSTDLIPDKDFDTDIVDEHLEDVTEDQDMLSKSLIEKDLSEHNKDVELHQIIESGETTNTDIVRVQNNINANNSASLQAEAYDDDDHTEMELSDNIEINPGIDMDNVKNVSNNYPEYTSVSSVNDGTKEHSSSVTVEMTEETYNHTEKDSFRGDHSSVNIVRGGYSNELGIPANNQSVDQSSPSSIRKLHISFKPVGNRTLTNNSDVIPTGQNFSKTDDTVGHTVVPSSGEKLKRVMCNPGSTQGMDNSEIGDPEEYEFVSVSKRVKSYEESLTSPQKSPQLSSPQFSPKIPRSPRVGRHLKNHHSHH